MKKCNYSKIKLDGFIPQGYTIVENKYTIISAYKPHYKSRLYLYNTNTGEYVYTIILENKDHVGGIAYDNKRKVLFVTSKKGLVNTYDFNKIKKIMVRKEPILDTNDIKIDNDIDISKYTKNNMASICFFDGDIYANTFGINSKLYKISYKMEINRSMITTNKITKLKNVGLAVQGIYFYKEKNITYLVTSTSCGKTNSRVNLYIVGKKLKHINTLNIKHYGIEGIYVNKGMISGIFEYGKPETFMISINTLKEITKSIHPLNKIKIFLNTLGFSIKRKSNK